MVVRRSPTVANLKLSSDPTPDPVVKVLLPEGYYLEHFCDVIQKIESTYLEYLTDHELRFVQSFRRLSEAQQRLYVRISNRKGTVFLGPTLAYNEIPNILGVIAELIELGFLLRACEVDFHDCVSALNKQQLLRLLEESGVSFDAKLSWSKRRLRETTLGGVQFAQFTQTALFGDLILQNHSEVLAYLYFLTFGDLWSDLTLYTLRDLGIRQSNAWVKNPSPRFATADEARSEFYFRSLRDRLRAIPDDEIPADFFDQSRWKPAVGPGARRTREKLAWELVQTVLRSGDSDTALRLLESEVSPRAVEKRIRVMYSHRGPQIAEAELDRLLADPPCSDVLLFAEDFHARKFGGVRVGVLTAALRAAQSITLNASYRGQPERGALAHFEAQGEHGYHAENHLWMSLFGIVFWDELFEGDNAAIHSEFERLPSDLLRGTFYQRQADTLEEKLRGFADVEANLNRIRSVIGTRSESINGVFSWHPSLGQLIEAFLRSAHQIGADVTAILRRIAQDFEGNRKGYPDLLVISEAGPRFVEIKTAGDSLNRLQLRQLKQLSLAGFPTEVVKVEWEYEDDQTYVVIDVETTGGFAGNDRVTEIGAVKLRKGAIIDRFSTLINPERRIPRHIAALTGISNEMVENAPLFAQIADSLAEFLDGSIFVAHNAQFDYGFISAEFRRIERPFRSPVFCTCTGMRRAFSGLESYGLKNLCRRFGVELKQHHRALCDAEATAQLLLILLRSFGDSQEAAP